MIDLKEYISNTVLLAGLICIFAGQVALLFSDSVVTIVVCFVAGAVLILPGFARWGFALYIRNEQMLGVVEAVRFCVAHKIDLGISHDIQIGCRYFPYWEGDYADVSRFEIQYMGQIVAEWDKHKTPQWKRFNAGAWIDDLLDAYRMERSKAKRAEKARFAPLPDEKRKREEDTSVEDLTYNNAVIHEHSDDISYIRYGREPSGRKQEIIN